MYYPLLTFAPWFLLITLRIVEYYYGGIEVIIIEYAATYRELAACI